jgi:hypothetical protein
MFYRMNAEILLGKAKEISQSQPFLTVNEILDQTVATGSADTQKYLNTPKTIASGIGKFRSRSMAFKDPVSKDELKIPTRFQATLRDQEFLWKDIPDNILIFASQENLEVNDKNLGYLNVICIRYHF